MGKQSSAIGDALRKQVANAAKMLILEIDANLRRDPASGGTPVDTGHARANWVPSLGVPHSVIESGEGAHDAGVAAVLGYLLGQGALYEANAVPYIESLNYGHSQQAPAMFVERCVAEALQTVQQHFAGRIDISSAAAGYTSAVGGAGAENLASAYSPFGD